MTDTAKELKANIISDLRQYATDARYSGDEYTTVHRIADRILHLITEAERVDENTSDGYHTFKELYRYRLLYNAGFFNELYRSHQNFDVHKSWQHSDGELCFGGEWFVVVAQLPTGQITNHYQEDDWPLFEIERRDVAAEWDGHTPQDVEKRLTEYLLSSLQSKPATNTSEGETE